MDKQKATPGAEQGSTEPAVSKVTLKHKGSESDKSKADFDMAHANRLLSLRNSRWELADDKHTWNGTEIAKK